MSIEQQIQKYQALLRNCTDDDRAEVYRNELRKLKEASHEYE